MLRNNSKFLWSSLVVARSLSSRVSDDTGATASWGEFLSGSIFEDPEVDLRGRSVLVATAGQFETVAALIQLDGIARRITLYPPDLSQEHLAFVAASAAAEVVVTDQSTLSSFAFPSERIIRCGREITPRGASRSLQIETEWILLTSGTMGLPKLVMHTLASLSGAIEPRDPSSDPIVWSTFYDIRRFGGLQIFLRAALTGTPLILSGAQESTTDFLVRAGALGVTHISGTPSHWRSALMSPSAGEIRPVSLRLSGEIADQAILNQLRSQYPQARVTHAFASTEAGVAFEVNDCLMGIPSEAIKQTPHVEMKVEGGTLRIRSSRTASCYLGEGCQPLKDADGFVDTGDVLEVLEGRYHFAGRRDGAINVGGLKVHPEEIEAVINRHPEVRMSLVKPRKSPITGALVVADVVLKTPVHSVSGDGGLALKREIQQFCRGELAIYKVPVAIDFVPSLAVAETGKLMRHNA
jgi:acyl-coenzyme A synthetase/AMP-(fatty) acid ligase